MLTSYSHARTSVISEAERAVSRSLASHRLVDVRGQFDLEHNVAWVGRVSLHYIDYGAELTILPHQSYEPYYLVQIPLRGSMELTTGSVALKAVTGTAVITEPGRATTVLRYSEHCSRLLVKMPSTLVAHCEKRYQPVGRHGQVFPEPLLDVNSGPGRSWVDLLRSTVTDLESGSGLLSRPQADSYFERLLIEGLLLTRSEGPAESNSLTRTVREAVVYIDSHLADAISVDDIATATHVSVRALQDLFRRELGLSPMSYLRDRRLDAIHDELQVSGPTTTVGAVARHFGVNHLGRFAAAYRQRFGQTPSETARH